MGSEFDSFDSSSEFDVYCGTSHFARGCGGNLVVVGSFTGADGNVLDRICILINGELVAINDNNSEEGPLVDGTIFDLIEYQGSLYITGEFTGGIAKLNDDTGEFDVLSTGLTGIGSSDQETNPGEGVGKGLAVYNGLLVVVGDFYDAAGVSDTMKVASWNGTAFLTMHSPPSFPQRFFAINEILDAHVFGGELYVSGGYRFFIGPVGTYQVLAKFTGSAWENAFDPWNGSQQLTTFESELWGVESFGLQKYPSGDEITVTGVLTAIAVVSAKLVVGGTATVVDGLNIQGVAQYSTATGWEAVGDGFGTNSSIRRIFEYEKEMYIVGSFNKSIDGETLQNILKLDKENNIWIKASKELGLIAIGYSMDEIENI